MRPFAFIPSTVSHGYGWGVQGLGRPPFPRLLRRIPLRQTPSPGLAPSSAPSSSPSSCLAFLSDAASRPSSLAAWDQAPLFSQPKPSSYPYRLRKKRPGHLQHWNYQDRRSCIETPLKRLTPQKRRPALISSSGQPPWAGEPCPQIPALQGTFGNRIQCNIHLS